MTLEELRQGASGNVDALWSAFRFLEEVMYLDDKASDEDKSFAVDCFLRLAVDDPDWATKALGKGGPDGHLLGSLLSEARLTSALSRLHLPNIKDDAMLRARLLCNSAKWRRDGQKELLLRAWAELLRVPEVDRDPSWKTLALTAAAIADYTSYRTLAVEHLISLTDPFWRSKFLPQALDVASRHRDWTTFDTWLADGQSLPAPMTRGHQACAVINLEGPHALDDNRPDDATATMQRLLEAGQGQPFLSNDDTSALPTRLRAEGRCLALCDTWNALVKTLDWRLVER